MQFKRNRPATGQNIVRRVLEARTALRELQADWERLQAAPGTSPALRSEWVQAYTDTFGALTPEAMQVVVLEEAGQVIGLAPMLRHDALAATWYESLGVRELYEPTDLLYRDLPAGRALVEALFQLGCPLVFERLPLNSSTRRLLGDAAGSSRCALIHRDRVASPTVKLTSDPNNLLNAGRRSDLRRARRKAEKLGTLETRILAPTPEELPSLLEVAFRIEAAGWKGRNESALLNETTTRTFFERYAALTAASGILRLGFLSVGGQPISMQFAAECGESLWLLKIGYEEKFAFCSPGNILMWDMLNYAVQRGLRSCEFLGNAAPWTKMWTEVEYPTACVTVLPVSWSSVVHVGLHAVRRLSARMKSNKRFGRDA